MYYEPIYEQYAYFLFLRSFQEKIQNNGEAPSPSAESWILQLENIDNINKLYPEALDKSYISWTRDCI